MLLPLTLNLYTVIDAGPTTSLGVEDDWWVFDTSDLDLSGDLSLFD